MLTNSVILVLQETLEAALLISLLLSLANRRGHGIDWLVCGVIGGLSLAYLYAANMETVSAWFDDVGQELVNSLIQTSIALLIAVYSWSLLPFSSSLPGQPNQKMGRWLGATATIMVVLAITREGSEILLYLSGFLQGNPDWQSVLAGSAIGFGIGLSIGTLLFFTLRGLPAQWGLLLSVLLLALFAGNMLSQAALQLTQADWLNASGAYWDSSAWLSEQSITGKLLYASLGYEATPSAVQVMAHVTGTLLVLFLVAGRFLLTVGSTSIVDTVR